MTTNFSECIENILNYNPNYEFYKKYKKNKDNIY